MFNKCLHASVLRNDSGIHLSSLLRWEFLFSSSRFGSRSCCCHIAFHLLVCLQIYTIFTIAACFSEKKHHHHSLLSIRSVSKSPFFSHCSLRFFRSHPFISPSPYPWNQRFPINSTEPWSIGVIVLLPLILCGIPLTMCLSASVFKTAHVVCSNWLSLLRIKES